MPTPGTKTPLTAVLALTALASVGTGVIWNGIAFIAQQQHAFSERRTLVLYLAMGATYALGAWRAGDAARLLRRRLTARAIIALSLVAQSIVSFLPLLSASAGVLWFVAVATSALSSLLWPLVESYLTSGRHGRHMRYAIGVWNIVWTASVAVSMLLMAPLLIHRPSDAIVMLGICNALALICVRFFAPAPAPHDAALSRASIREHYPRLLVAFRVLLLLSYVVSEALAPLLPYLIEGVLQESRDSFVIAGLEVSWRTIVAAVWMLARVGAIAIMWRLPFWHGSWRTVHLGALTLAVGFAIIVAAPALASMLAGLAIFGIGVGVIYYAAIYYAMSVGAAEVDAGGTHEAMIGVGYALGPAAGLLGFALADAIGPLTPPAGVIAVVWAMLAAGGILALVLVRRTPAASSDSVV